MLRTATEGEHMSRDTAGQPCGGRGRDRRAVSIGNGGGVKVSKVVMKAKRRQRFYRERQAAGEPGRELSNQRQTSPKSRTQCHVKYERAHRSRATTSAPGAAAAACAVRRSNEARRADQANCVTLPTSCRCDVHERRQRVAKDPRTVPRNGARAYHSCVKTSVPSSAAAAAAAARADQRSNTKQSAPASTHRQISARDATEKAKHP